jgi:hypothetical protein
MLGGSFIVTLLIVCPFLIVAAFTLPIILVRYLRGDFRDKEDKKDKGE